MPFRGVPLVRRAALAGLAAGCGPVVVVAGAHEDGVRAAVAGLDVTVTANDAWSAGIGTSIQAGVRTSAEWTSVTGLLLMLADQPLISTDTLHRVLDARRPSTPIVAARYSNTVGVPAYFAREMFTELLSIRPGEGCKGILHSSEAEAVFLDLPEAAFDVDTPGDMEALVRMG